MSKIKEFDCFLDALPDLSGAMKVKSEDGGATALKILDLIRADQKQCSIKAALDILDDARAALLMMTWI